MNQISAIRWDRIVGHCITHPYGRLWDQRLKESGLGTWEFLESQEERELAKELERVRHTRSRRNEVADSREQDR